MHNWRCYPCSKSYKIDKKCGSEFGALMWRRLTPQRNQQYRCTTSSSYTQLPKVFWKITFRLIYRANVYNILIDCCQLSKTYYNKLLGSSTRNRHARRIYIGGRSENNIKCVVVHNDLGRKNRTTRYKLQAFCRVTGSTSDFLSFVVVEHIRFFNRVLRLLCDVSAVAGVDAELEQWSATVVSEAEKVIVSQWRDVFADEKHELRVKVDKVLRPLGFRTRLLVMRRANGVALYFICLTLSAVRSLRDQWCSRELGRIVRELFTLLSTPLDTVPVKRLIWPVTDYEQCLDFFISVQGKEFRYILCTCIVGLNRLSTVISEYVSFWRLFSFLTVRSLMTKCKQHTPPFQ